MTAQDTSRCASTVCEAQSILACLSMGELRKVSMSGCLKQGGSPKAGDIRQDQGGSAFASSSDVTGLWVGTGKGLKAVRLPFAASYSFGWRFLRRPHLAR